MVKIAVVEDEKKVQEQLVNYIEEYEKESGEKFEITEFSDGEQIVERYAGTYDIIFLDIEMKHTNGMEAARIIRKLDENVILIFVTNMASYAIQGYEVMALSYVLKPVNYFVFSQELAKAVKRVKSLETKYLTVTQDQGVVRLPLSQVSYLESEGHNIVIHSEQGTFSFRGTVKGMEEKLAGENFVRCNSGYLVNLEHVKRVNHNIAVVSGEELQISRPRKKAFMEALTNYLGGK